MSDRERWTIYPLLFLALALGLRDRLFPPAPPEAMALRELTIVGDDNRADIRLRGSTQQGASPSIQILNGRGQPSWLAAVVPQTGLAIQETGALVARDVRIIGPDGRPRVVVGVGKGSQHGVIEWFAADGKQLLVAGGHAGDGGAITSYRDGVEQFSVGSNERGTLVVVRSAEGKPYLVLACDDNQTGRALVFDREGRGQVLVGQPVEIKLQDVDSSAPAPGEQGPKTSPPGEEEPAGAAADPPAGDSSESEAETNPGAPRSL